MSRLSDELALSEDPVAQFTDTLTEIANQTIPKFLISKNKFPKVPWFNNVCKQATAVHSRPFSFSASGRNEVKNTVWHRIAINNRHCPSACGQGVGQQPGNVLVYISGIYLRLLNKINLNLFSKKGQDNGI